MAIQGQALFDEVETYCQILDQELEKFVLHMKQNEMENIEIQWDRMKIRRGMTFKPKPIVHFEEPLEDSGRIFVKWNHVDFVTKDFIAWMLLLLLINTFFIHSTLV